MSNETKKINWLYETSVKKQVEEKVVTKDEKDPTIEVTRTTKKAKPIKVAILKPNRRLFESAEIFYAATVADYIRRGLLPLSLAAKRYANDGGPISDPEKDVINALRDEVTKYELEYFSLDTKDVSDTTKAKRNELLVKINDVNARLNSIQNAYSDIYDNTAEMKAKNKTIEWWVLHLAYYDLDEKGYKPIFGDGPYESKLDVYENLDDNGDPFTLEAIGICSYLISFWLTARGTLSKEEMANLEFKAMESLYLESVTSYKVEETEEKPTVKLNETPPPEEPAKPAEKPLT